MIQLNLPNLFFKYSEKLLIHSIKYHKTAVSFLLHYAKYQNENLSNGFSILILFAKADAFLFN